jgi:hypothetical protein
MSHVPLSRTPRSILSSRDDHENRGHERTTTTHAQVSKSRRIPTTKALHPVIKRNNLSCREQHQEADASRGYRDYRMEEERYKTSVRDEQDEILEDLENQLYELSDGHPRVILKPRADQEGDILDYVFESVENFICRNKEDHNDNQAGYEGEDEKSIVENESRLQKIPNKNYEHDQAMEYDRDVLDYVFECGDPGDLEPEMFFRQRHAKDQTILVDRLIEPGHDNEARRQSLDWKDANVLVPMRLSQLPEGSWACARSNSIADEYCSSDETTEESRPIGRLEILRSKKRKLEARQQMVAEYMATESSGLTTKEMDQMEAQLAKSQVENTLSSHLALVEIQPEGEYKQQARLILLASILMFFLGTGFVVAAAVVFFPGLL